MGEEKGSIKTMHVITGERNTRTYQLLVWRKAIEMEIRGMKMSRGVSVSAIAGKFLGMPERSRKAKVLKKLNEHIDEVQRGICDPCTMKGWDEVYKNG